MTNDTDSLATVTWATQLDDDEFGCPLTPPPLAAPVYFFHHCLCTVALMANKWSHLLHGRHWTMAINRQLYRRVEGPHHHSDKCSPQSRRREGSHWSAHHLLQASIKKKKEEDLQWIKLAVNVYVDVRHVASYSGDTLHPPRCPLCCCLTPHNTSVSRVGLISPTCLLTLHLPGALSPANDSRASFIHRQVLPTSSPFLLLPACCRSLPFWLTFHCSKCQLPPSLSVTYDLPFSELCVVCFKLSLVFLAYIFSTVVYFRFVGYVAS